jgi:hypothetical protein
MKTLFKWFGLALVVQVLLLTFVVVAMDRVIIFDRTVPDRYLTIYEPFIILISRLGNYRGEGAIIYPVIKGVPLGVLGYSLIAGVLALVIRRIRGGRRIDS